MAEAAVLAGVSESGAAKWVAESGGMIPDLDEPSDCYLSLAEREEIAADWNAGYTRAQIARRIGRHRSTVGRELARNKAVGRPQLPRLPDGQRRARGPRPGTNRGRDRPQHERLRYRASVAQSKAEQRARRGKPGKLAANPELREQVQTRLTARLGRKQIAATLGLDFPDRPEMWVSHETIYQALYVQGRGELRRELTRCLRTGRALRRPRRVPGEQRGKRAIPTELMISARPHRRSRPRRHAGGHLNPARPAVAVPDLGPRQRNGAARRDHPGHRPGHLLLRPTQPLATRQQRKHQRAAASVLPQRQRPIRAQRRTPGRGRRRTQHPTPQNARLEKSDPSPQPPTVTPIDNRRCCDDPLNSSSSCRCGWLFFGHVG